MKVTKYMPAESDCLKKMNRSKAKPLVEAQQANMSFRRKLNSSSTTSNDLSRRSRGNEHKSILTLMKTSTEIMGMVKGPKSTDGGQRSAKLWCGVRVAQTFLWRIQKRTSHHQPSTPSILVPVKANGFY
jgi:hypothetical protein